MEPMSQNFSNWEKPNTRTRAPPRPAPKTHLVRGWDYQVYSKWERDTLTHPAPGLGWGWERDSDNWDGNGVGVAWPKPAPLPILRIMAFSKRRSRIVEIQGNQHAAIWKESN